MSLRTPCVWLMTAAVLAGWLIAVPAAQAAWVIQPSAQVRTSWEDNIRLDESEDGGLETEARIQSRFANQTENSSVSAVLGFNYLMYSGFGDENGTSPLDNKDEEFLTLSAQRRMERTTFSIRSDLRTDVLLRSVNEISDDFGLDAVFDGTGQGTDPGDTLSVVIVDDPVDNGASDSDVNVVREQVRRKRFYVAPNVNYSLTERTNVSLGYTYFGLRYDSTGEDAGLQNSNSHGLNTQLRRRWSERDSFDLNLRGYKFEPDNGGDSKNYSATVGWNREVSERLTFSVEVGGRRVDADDAGTDTGFTYRAQSAWRTERGRFRGFVERANLPSAYGDVAVTDRLNIGYDRRITDRWTMSASVIGYRTSEDRDDTRTSRDRKQFSVNPEISWRFTEEMNLGLGYSYRWIDRERDPDSASGNSVSLSLTYAPLRRF